MSENQNVDQKWRVFPKKLHAANGIFLKSIRRKPAGTWHHSPDTVLGKEAPQGHLMGRMGNSAGELFGWEHLGILECFLLFFFPLFFPPSFGLLWKWSPKSVILQRVFRCKTTGYVSPDQPDSILLLNKSICVGFYCALPIQLLQQRGK